MKIKLWPSGKRGAGAGPGGTPRDERPIEHPAIVHVDPAQLDAETRAVYRDAREAAAEAKVEESTRRKHEFVVSRPFQLGFTATLGVLIALVVGGIVVQLGTVIMYVASALFLALGLDPVVRWLERHKIPRPAGIAIVFAGFVAVVAGLIALIAPVITKQVTQLINGAPDMIRDLNEQNWFVDLNQRFHEYVDFEGLLKTGQDFVSQPKSWATVAGGVWEAGMGIANGVTAAIIILILTLYFLASLRSIKRAFYALVPRSGRAQVIDITEQVTKSVGAYIVGQVSLAAINALLGYVMMLIVGVPFAGIVVVGVFLFALIPLVGSLCATVLVALVALIDSPTTALIALIYYLVYMQIEAYVLSPRIMSRAVSVPGAFVVIGALTGGTLLGLLGALIAIPVTASILMIVKQVWVPRQQRR